MTALPTTSGTVSLQKACGTLGLPSIVQKTVLVANMGISSISVILANLMGEGWLMFVMYFSFLLSFLKMF